ncbi:MAG: S46 family peptidase, partial [Bacteroidales bacterium]|nr:S46 family peptidase [Bacteroidales bacterium]
MKRIFCSIAAALVIATSAMADEGMWLLPLIQQLNAGAMKDLGCRLTPDQIYSVNHSSLKDAIVIFGGGCTGEMISDQGLLVTNHHCGYGTIQALSSDEHNYLEDGYWAMSREQEIPAPGLSVTYLVSMTDVTDAINKAEDAGATREALQKAAQENNPNCRVQVTSFYNENVWYLIVYKTYTDVRFVGA